MRVRHPAVAGTFYPERPDELRNDVRQYLADGSRDVDIHGAPLPPAEPVAVIAPHAGYAYSGPVAGTAYACLADAAHRIRRVLLLGPAHHVPFRGVAAPTDEAWSTPLGQVSLDVAWRDRALELKGVQAYDEPHAPEHSLEVQLPFLQELLPEATILPLLVGSAAAEEVADTLDALWPPEDEGTVVVVSSDLSHYLDYDTALDRDAETARAVESLQMLEHQEACGRLPINGLLLLAGGRRLRPVTMDLRNSGDTAGPRDRVVGYGAFVFQPAPELA